jgi:NADH-quinone oxidoreductase subunit H
MFFMAEYMHIVTISSIAVTLFWGGWNGPRIAFLPALWPVVWYLLKTSVFIFFFFWIRASMPRLRYDQLMNIGWKFLIPIGIVWIPISAAARIVDLRQWILWIVGTLLGLVIIGTFWPAREVKEEATLR